MRVIWHEKALLMLYDILDYGLQKFGEQRTGKFYGDLLRTEKIIQHNPNIGKVENISSKLKYEYRSIVIGKRYKLIYFINNDTIYISAFWCCSRSPRKLKSYLGN